MAIDFTQPLCYEREDGSTHKIFGDTATMTAHSLAYKSHGTVKYLPCYNSETYRLPVSPSSLKVCIGGTTKIVHSYTATVSVACRGALLGQPFGAIYVTVTLPSGITAVQDIQVGVKVTTQIGELITTGSVTLTAGNLEASTTLNTQTSNTTVYCTYDIFLDGTTYSLREIGIRCTNGVTNTIQRDLTGGRY